MLSICTLIMVVSIDHQLSTNDQLKPVMATGLVNMHIDRSIANLGPKQSLVLFIKHWMSCTQFKVNMTHFGHHLL